MIGLDWVLSMLDGRYCRRWIMENEKGSRKDGVLDYTLLSVVDAHLH